VVLKEDSTSWPHTYTVKQTNYQKTGTKTDCTILKCDMCALKVRGICYLVLIVFLLNCRQIRIRAVATKAVEILYTNTQISRLVLSVMLQCWILRQKSEPAKKLSKAKFIIP
jgi:hypothetical protein